MSHFFLLFLFVKLFLFACLFYLTCDMHEKDQRSAHQVEHFKVPWPARSKCRGWKLMVKPCGPQWHSLAFRQRKMSLQEWIPTQKIWGDMQG